ncbi:MAG: PepSY domain-containing protein [Elusimicrobia bacterium]|nr:PepSY domain-containing protein [Elusimicrobiota bacterium]
MRLAWSAALAMSLIPTQAQAVKPSPDGRREARRFGLDQLERRVRRGPDKKTLKVFQEFRRREGTNWELRFDPRTGKPAALTGGKARVRSLGPAGLAAGRAPRPEQAAGLFLAETKDLLGIDPGSLLVEKKSSSDGHSHLLYRQTYRGLPVEFARVKVHLGPGGSVLGVNSRFEPDLSLDTEPSLNARQAAQAVERDLGLPPRSEGSLVIFPNERSGRSHLAWKFSVSGRGGLWRYYVDAHTGEILFRYNDLRFQAPPVCTTSGTVRGLVYDIDPVTTPTPVARPFLHQKVYVASGSSYALTGGDPIYGQGFFCSATAGKVFSQLQGPFVNVSNARGPSAHFDNGSGVWSTVATSASSPHPYSNSATHLSTIDISALAPTAVKFLPIFSSFNVGAISSGEFGEALDIADDDEVHILDSAGNPVAAYLGSLGSFKGAAVPGQTMTLRLKSNSSGQNTGYDVSLSSWLALTAPAVINPAGSSFTWSPAEHAYEAMRSELSLFYHLNLMHDYFMADVNKSSAAYLGAPVAAMALAGPNLVNAFYNPEHDDLYFGDVSAAQPSDAFTDDATVVHHEYTHYVVEKIWPIQNFGQAGAISEGVADYFSASSLNTSAIGTFVVTTLGGNGPLRELDCPTNTACRVLSNTNWSGEIHDDSLFLSQTLWDIRKDRVTALGAAVGRSCADGLAFQALLFFPESFQEFLDAMRRADSLGLVSACGGAGTAQTVINSKFASHGLTSVAGVSDSFDTASARNDGFETAVDVATRPIVSASIYPAGDLDFYTFGAGAGRITATMDLPADGSFYKGYALTLYDLNHRAVATAAPAFDGINTDSGFCTPADCTTTQSQVRLTYDNGSAGQFYLQVAGGETVGGGSNSGVNSTAPYTLRLSVPSAGALSASLVSASFDNDRLSFSVRVTTFPRTQDYNFAYAQLRDHAQNALPGTLSHVPAQAGDYLLFLSSNNALGNITGQLQLASGFAARFPAVGTIHLEVFAYNVAGSTVSLGLSQALNLTTNQSALTAWNNVFNPARGEKTTIKYEVQSPGKVTLRLYTLGGTLVSTLFDGEVPAGKGSVDWNGTNYSGTVVASGIYLLRMTGPGFSKTQKVAVVK